MTFFNSKKYRLDFLKTWMYNSHMLDFNVRILLAFCLIPQLFFPPGVCLCRALGLETKSTNSSPIATPLVFFQTQNLTKTSNQLEVGDFSTSNDPLEHLPGCPARRNIDGQFMAETVDLTVDLPLLVILAVFSLDDLKTQRVLTAYNDFTCAIPIPDLPFFLRNLSLLI